MNGRSSLRNMVSAGKVVRAIGVHDGISAILAERAGFDALWISGLCISTARGVADAGLLTMTEFHEAAVQVRQVSSLPIISDVDAGFGDVNVVQRMVRLYEASGIDAVCIEDKEYPKRNSFLEGHRLATTENFCQKIEAAKLAQTGKEFMLIARLEALIAGAGMEQTLKRAAAYAAAGADAVLVHSKSDTSSEVAEFCRNWREMDYRLPVYAIPTTYYRTHVQELHQMGVSVVIYANQAMRASVAAMSSALSELDASGRTEGLEDHITPLTELFDLVNTSSLINP